MDSSEPTLWTIGELAAQAAATLSTVEVDQSSGRVSEVPSTRTIRYYSTHGLIDRPADHRGRTALYGRRHLLQLVAIKQLQARGVPLTEIQSSLAGVDDEELARLAAVDQAAAGSKGGEPHPAAPRTERENFWARSAPAVERGGGTDEKQAGAGAKPAIRLGDGVLLVIDGASREVWDDDLEAIAVAAGPLMEVLRRRRILGDH